MEGSRSLFTERQVGALCWRKKGKAKALQILLVTSRETKRWVIPKGWPMDHLTDWNAARREAFEEAGASGRMSKSSIGFYHYDKRKKRGQLVPTRVDVYSFEVDEMHKSWPERHERTRNWFTPLEAATHVGESELKSLIANFKP
jgi:8-oxo-dGTP pyrophosphatase MutT (NUDIX family)